MKHVCGGVVMPHDVLSSAMKHANQLLRMDYSVEGAVDRASSMFNTEVTYATFESNFYAVWVHTRKCMHPELTSKVSGIIHQCWQAGNSTELGNLLMVCLQGLMRCSCKKSLGLVSFLLQERSHRCSRVLEGSFELLVVSVEGCKVMDQPLGKRRPG